MNNKLLIWIFVLLIIPNVNAFIVNGVTANQDTYQDGDLIILTISANKEDLEVYGDFSTADSLYNSNAVVTESNGFSYKVYYALTFANTRGDGIYNSVISFYDPDTQTSSTVTYGVNLDNQGNQSYHKETIKLKVRGDAQYSVEEGKIKICDSEGCVTLTEEEYEQSKNLIITSGSVTLSNLTYTQLRDEIAQSVKEDVDANLQAHLSQILDAARLVESAVEDVNILLQNASVMFHNQSQESQRLLNQTKWTGIVMALGIVVLIAGAFYLFYLKTNTTWLE